MSEISDLDLDTLVDATLLAQQEQLSHYQESPSLTSFERAELGRDLASIKEERGRRRAEPPTGIGRPRARLGVERTGPTEQPWYELVGRLLRGAIEQEWLHGTATPVVTVGPAGATGATDAIILKANVSIELFVKLHELDCTKEEQGFRTLSEVRTRLSDHLIPPLTTTGHSLFWLTPFVDAITFHDLVARSEARDRDWIRGLHADLLLSEKDLWARTKTGAPPDLWDIYVNRVDHGLQQLEDRLHVADLTRLKLFINGEPRGTFAEIRSKFEDGIQRANVTFSCTTHGDDHAKNIVVYRRALRNDSTAWKIIDYVNARRHSDWMFSVAKMLHWWQFYFVLELAKHEEDIRESIRGNMTIAEDRLLLEYDEAALAAPCQDLRLELREQIMTAAREIAGAFEEPEDQWRQRLGLALFAIVFGSVWRHFGAAEFAIPIMIGESIKPLLVE